ncbi:MAG: hypothetical protein IPM47_07225 [Sphingobacteriales bacterium]|nr:MAG: hypothetical protein IPM47_07225 [Sphingobacteriales bacterium]
MPYRLFSLLMLLFFISENLLIGQNTKYRKTYLQPWEQRPDFEHTISPEFLDQDAVILSESTEWTFNNRFNSTLVTTHRRVKILTAKGITTGATINIPEVTDPSSEFSDLTVYHRKGIHRPKFFDLEIIHFKARILKPDGQLKIVLPEDTIQTEKLLYSNRDRFAYSYHFTIPQAVPGDIVEISYSWYLPFVFDWKRIFLHLPLPAQTRTFHLTVPSRELLLLHLHNGLPAPDTLFSTKAPDFNHTYTWKLTNLPACLYEPNARLYADLPHLTFYLHNKAFGILRNDEFVAFKPYTWNYFSYDMVSFRDIKIHKTKRFLSSKELALNSFFSEQTQNIDKDQAFKLMEKLQKTLAEEFEYIYEQDYFNNNDERMAKIGSSRREIILKELNKDLQFQGPFDRISNQLYAHVLTEGYRGLTDAKREKVALGIKNKQMLNINRYVIYEGLLTRVKKDFFRVLVSDKRIGKINPDTCLPVFGQVLMYSFQSNNELTFVFPKNSRFGYQLNELPFYLENTPSLHIWQMADSHLNPKTTQFFQTPVTSLIYNFRTSNIHVKVNLNTNQLNFNSKITLSGQYSTLIRGFYQYNVIDSTVNPGYYRHLSRLSDKSTPSAKPEIQIQEGYPFKTEIQLNYKDNSLLTKVNDTTYRISLTNWIQHVIVEGLNVRKRTLPFYSDFTGTDTYNYYLEFDRDIYIEAFKDLPLAINNDFGTYSFDIRQTKENSISIQSVFKTKAERIPADGMFAVEEVYKYIRQMENASVTIFAGSGKAGKQPNK